MITLIDQSSKIFDVAGLLHDEAREHETVNYCPYNFVRDIDARCFKNALARFLRTGTKEDAFDVFFCYSEIFQTFGGYQKGIDTLLNLLYDHESNAAMLLEKYRDHYSHSVYVFALGLAIFMNNKKIRDAFAKKYGGDKVEFNFLKAWGMAALFHDVGYPYEITYLQFDQYGKQANDENAPKLKMAYRDLPEFIKLSDAAVERCGNFMPSGRSDLHSLFVERFIDTFGTLGVDAVKAREDLSDLMRERITKDYKKFDPDNFMDHGYFSAAVFMRNLLEKSSDALDALTLDAVMAMLLHNSFYKRSYRQYIAGDKYKHVSAEQQPLAYLLMLCDELQCWDRMPYGKNSKKEELAWDVDITVDDNKLEAVYYYEIGAERDTKKVRKLIGGINADVVDCSQIFDACTATVALKKKDKKIYTHLSSSKFIDLRYMAESINDSYNEEDVREETDTDNSLRQVMAVSFDERTLEYKLSNIAQAKNYINHIDSIGCFFSDRQLDYVPVDKFTDEEIEYLAVREHIRWVNEKVGMGWKYGKPNDKIERENLRIHKDIIPYENLDKTEKSKDVNPMNRMIGKLGLFGIKVYRLNGKKAERAIGCIDHANSAAAKSDETELRSNIRTYIRELSENYRLKLYSAFVGPTDMLFVEEALKCGVDVVAVLPCAYLDFMKKHSDGERFMQLLGQTCEVIEKPNGGEDAHMFVNVDKFILENSDELFAVANKPEKVKNSKLKIKIFN